MTTQQKSAVEEFVENRDDRNLFLEERAIMRITDLVEEVMEQEHVSRTDLAKRLGTSKGWVTQLLDGENNKTIRTVARVLAELDRQLEFKASSIAIGKSRPFKVKIATVSDAIWDNAKPAFGNSPDTWLPVRPGFQRVTGTG
jgi:plasmid maintenance system antidote protein VapI